MNIFLIQPPVWGIFDPPNGITQISAFLKKHKKQAKFIDLNIEVYNTLKSKYAYLWAIENSSFWTNKDNVDKFFHENEKVLKDILFSKYDFENSIVALSVNVCSLHFSKILAQQLKKSFKNVYIIFGGPMFIVDYNEKEIFSDDCIDFVINGEAELTFLELVDFIEKGEEFNKCQGISFIKDGEVIRTPDREYIKNLDDLPFLDFDEVDFNKYDPPGHLGKHISLMTSRGCIMSCVFCGPRGYWKGYRTMSGKRIYEEIYHHIKRHPEIEHIEFLDLLFNGNLKVLDEFVTLMSEKKPKKNLKWHANMVIRGDMTEEIFIKMKKAGCEHITYGIESGSQKVLSLMRKRYKIDAADRILKYTHQAGIKVTCNFMFGFPGETEEDFQETLKFLERNAKHINVAYPSRTYCTIEPHSYMAEHLDEFEIIPNEVHGQYWESKDGKNNYPVRLRRAEEFTKLAEKLGVDVGLGLQTSVEQDKFFNLANYCKIKKDFTKALYYFKKYLELNPQDYYVSEKIKLLERKI